MLSSLEKKVSVSIFFNEKIFKDQTYLKISNWTSNPVDWGVPAAVDKSSASLKKSYNILKCLKNFRFCVNLHFILDDSFEVSEFGRVPNRNTGRDLLVPNRNTGRDLPILFSPALGSKPDWVLRNTGRDLVGL